jgi:hypothetical protein
MSPHALPPFCRPLQAKTARAYEHEKGKAAVAMQAQQVSAGASD